MNDEAPVKVDPKVEKQKAWLAEITGRLVKSAENQQDLENRAKGKALIDGLEGEKAGIRETLLGVEVKVKGGLMGKKMKLLDPEGNYRNEIDTWHHAKEMREGMTPEQLKTVTAQVEKIMAVQQQLKANPYYHAAEPEFTAIPEYDFESMTEEERDKAQQELDALLEKRQQEEDDYAKLKAECDKHMAEDLWEPMVREGIIPENFVPQDYSAVAKLFQNASTEYEERLQEYSANLTEKDILLEKFGVGFKIGKGVLKLAGSTTGLVGSIGEMTGDDGLVSGAEDAAEFLGHFETALTISEGLTKAVLTDKDFTSVGEMLADTLGTALGSVPGLDPMAAQIITSCVSNAVRAVKVGKFIKAGDLEGAMNTLVEAVAGELANFDPDEGGGLMTEIGANLTRLVGAAMSGKKIGTMIAEGRSPLEIISAMMDVADDIAGDAIAGVGEDLAGKFNKAVGIGEDEEDDKEEEGGDGEEDTSGQDWVDGEKVRKGKFDMEALKKRQLEADALGAEKIKQSMEEQIEAEREEFEHHLRAGFPMAMSDEDEVNQSETDRIQSIEFLIAIQKKNEATFNMAKQIAEKGVALLVKLFPPASLAQACMTLAFTIKDAVRIRRNSSSGARMSRMRRRPDRRRSMPC